METRKKPGRNFISYSEAEKCLLDYLETNEKVSVGKFARMAHLSYKQAEQTIINFRALHILKDHFADSRIGYSINENFDRGEWEKGNSWMGKVK